MVVHEINSILSIQHRGQFTSQQVGQPSINIHTNVNTTANLKPGQPYVALTLTPTLTLTPKPGQPRAEQPNACPQMFSYAPHLGRGPSGPINPYQMNQINRNIMAQTQQQRQMSQGGAPAVQMALPNTPIQMVQQQQMGNLSHMINAVQPIASPVRMSASPDVRHHQLIQRTMHAQLQAQKVHGQIIPWP